MHLLYKVTLQRMNLQLQICTVIAAQILSQCWRKQVVICDGYVNYI